MSSFSANREGRPRPSNIIFGRRRSDDKPMPSPSFNSSMSLGKVDDVFFDSTRSVDRLRHHYLAMPATPSSLDAGSSPGTRMERLPSLTELFNRDILSPPSSGGPTLSSLPSDQHSELMRRTSSISSASSGRSRLWIPSFHHDSQSGSIGPPATPLSPFFALTSSGPLISPRTISSDQSLEANSDGERTPRASSRSSFDHPERPRGLSPCKCPGAPAIGVLNHGHFLEQTWQQQRRVGSLGSFQGVRQQAADVQVRSAHPSAEDLSEQRAAMARRVSDMPKAPGLNGLGIYMDEDNIQSPFREVARSHSRRIESQEISPSSHFPVGAKHTGLTPMVKASKVSAAATTTPTRTNAKTSPVSHNSLLSESPRHTTTKAASSSNAAKKKPDVAQTPLGKSRPIFRFDTGSGKRPKGHKMSPNASPWGVFGVKDGWKPLAPPNVSRALAEANKLVAETALAASVSSSPSQKSSPLNKRHAHGTGQASSPSKRSRNNDSPGKENQQPALGSFSPSKRAHLRSKVYRDSPTALPLSTIR